VLNIIIEILVFMFHFLGFGINKHTIKNVDYYSIELDIFEFFGHLYFLWFIYNTSKCFHNL